MVTSRGRLSDYAWDMKKTTLVQVVGSVLGAGLWLRAPNAYAFSEADPARILYVGDSIAAETRDTVKWWTWVTGKAEFANSIFPGMAICDFLEGKPDALPEEMRLKSAVRRHRPHLVILQFWGNALTPCMHPTADSSGVVTEAYYNQYFWDALNAVEHIRDAAADAGIPKPRLLWVLQGPDKALRERTARLNRTYAFVAEQSGDRTSDAGFEVSMAAYPYEGSHDRYEWTQFLPCSAFEHQMGYCTYPDRFGGVAQIHHDDDPTHFCLGGVADFMLTCAATSPGIYRYGMRIAGDANAWLGI
jgi:hypothetical protein